MKANGNIVKGRPLSYETYTILPVLSASALNFCTIIKITAHYEVLLLVCFSQRTTCVRLLDVQVRLHATKFRPSLIFGLI